MTVCYYHVTHESHSDSTLYSLPECQGRRRSWLEAGVISEV